MNGISLIIADRIGLATVAICLLAVPRPGTSHERNPETDPPKVSENTVDPFVDEDKAAEALAGIWEYSADYSLKSEPIRNVPGLIGPDGQLGWPFEEQQAGKPKAGASPEAIRKMSSHVRLDFRSKSKFRIEMAISDHSDKTCSYSFGEGTWKLRGRLLVLTFLLDDEIDRWGVFVEKLASEEIVVTGIGDSVELFNGGRGVLTKKESSTPVSIPKGYTIEVDETSYGSATTDIAEYLRDHLKIDVELTKGAVASEAPGTTAK